MRGHLRQRGSSSWELRVYAGRDPITNRQTYVTRTLRGGKRDAEEALTRLLMEVSGGSQAAEDTTVGMLLREWLELARPELSPTTSRGYDWIIKTYITPTLETVPLARLKPAQLDRFYDKLRKSGGRDGKQLSPATVRQVHAILRRALHQGEKWGWITSNPAALASPPRGRSPQLKPPDPDEVVRLIEAAEANDPDLACFLIVAATTGARRGELCAMRWTDLDLDGRVLTISRSVVEAEHSNVLEKDTKTHASRRIALDTATVDVLVEQRDRCAVRAKACGSERLETSHVFSRDADGERPWVPNDVTKGFIRLRKSVGLSTVRLHDLRHFAATRLLSAGVPVRTVSGRLGHANAATTLGVYAHFVEESDREAATKLGSILSRSRNDAAVRRLEGAASNEA